MVESGEVIFGGSLESGGVIIWRESGVWRSHCLAGVLSLAESLFGGSLAESLFGGSLESGGVIVWLESGGVIVWR
jgi:hypothetical protein